MKPLRLCLAFFLLAGCSALPDLSAFLPQPSATLTFTHTPTTTLVPGETRLPTDTPTITLTPTAISTRTPFASRTATQRPTITFPAPVFGLSTLGSSIFSPVQISGGLIQWGRCGGPEAINFTVRVAKTKGLYYVLLFLRLQDKYSSLGTEWGAGAIMHGNKAVYTYTVTVDNITRYQDFDDAWLQYQIVASDSRLNHLGSSIVHYNEISITHCATPTP